MRLTVFILEQLVFWTGAVGMSLVLVGFDLEAGPWFKAVNKHQMVALIGYNGLLGMMIIMIVFLNVVNLVRFFKYRRYGIIGEFFA